MHVPHRGRAPVASCASVEVLEGVEVLAGDTAALGEQGREVVRPGAEGLAACFCNTAWRVSVSR